MPAPLFRQILHATDFSRASAKAFTTAVDVARATGATLTIAHALAQVLPVAAGEDPVLPETYERVSESYQPDRDDVVFAAFQGEGGHPVLLSRSLVERLGDVAQAAPVEDTLAEFLEAHAERRRYVDAQDPAVLININTPDAYKTHLGDGAEDGEA